MDKLTVISYAKLNLYLEVLSRRKDNYHNIRTIFERIDLADTIILKALRDKTIKIICDSSLIPDDASNLAYRSAKLLQDELRINRGAEIKIIKRIPVGAGLGGGSSNAASALMGLNKLWKLGLARQKLVKLAQKIGSDVPFFVYNCAFAEGRNRGDRIRPLPGLNRRRLWHILIVPRIKVSTPLIYRRWDTLKQAKKVALTKPLVDVKILTSAIRDKKAVFDGLGLFNSLEQVTCGLYPQIAPIKEKLKKIGVKSVLMSGSGPAVFGIVSSRKEAVALGRQLKRENSFWQVFVTGTSNETQTYGVRSRLGGRT